ncbi:MAG: efflux RND transporter permease subunit [Thermoanaerobaculia bacterium]|nr:efflux RND transporter permease subunit [Thermoanaerobaculia bacterium]
MTPRRAIIVLALLVLGAVSISRLDFRYAPEISSNDVVVWLSVPSSSSDVASSIATRWAVPLESALRGTGDLDGMRATVSPSGVRILARFKPGIDMRAKLARIGNDLAAIRAKLPKGGNVGAWSGRPANESARLFLAGTDDIRVIRRVRDALEGLPSVSSVHVTDERSDELRVTIDGRLPGTPTLPEVSRVVAAAESVESFGDWDLESQRLAVVGVSAKVPLADRPVRVRDSVVRLGSIAAVESATGELRGEGRWEGRRATAYFLARHTEASVLQFDRELRAAVAGLDGTLPRGARLVVAESEADPLRRMLRFVVLGMLLCLPILALAGWWIGGRPGAAVAALFMPLAVSVAGIVLHLSRLSLDATTLPAVCVALGGAVPVALAVASRRAGIAPLVTACASSSLVAIGTALSTGALAPYLAPTARVFFAASLAGVAAALILPPIAERAARRGRGPFMRASREAATTLLGATAVALALFTFFGTVLDPRSAAREPDRMRITVEAPLPEGSTLSQARRRAELIEEKLAAFRGVERSWGWVDEGGAYLVAEVDTDYRKRTKYDELSSSIAFRLRRAAGGTIRIGDPLDGRQGLAASLFTPVELVPDTDDEVRFYRFLILGTDLDDVANAIERAIEPFRKSHEYRAMSRFGTRSLRVELSVRPGADARGATALAEALASKGAGGEATPSGRDRVVLVRQIDAAVTADDAPVRQELLERPIRAGGSWVVPSSLLDVRERVVLVDVTRQGGRFVAPVTVTFFVEDDETRHRARADVDRTLRGMSLPAGVDVQLPDLDPVKATFAKWRLYALTATLPILIALVAMIWSNSIWRPVALLLPLIVGLGLAAAFVGLSGTTLDELSLALVAAALCAAMPGLLPLVPPERKEESLVVASYRAGRAATLPLAAGSFVALVMLVVPALVADPGADSWAVPMRAAGIALCGSFAAAVVLPSATLLGAEALRRRMSPEFRSLRRPPEWTARGNPTLHVGHATKRYRNGVRALDDVSFELSPGVVGLLGPNGAGKTTLLRIMTGLIQPTRGRVLFRGVPVGPANIGRYRDHVGFLPQDFNAYPGFTAAQFLDYWAMERGITDRRQRLGEIEMLLAAVGLEEHANRKVRDFSGGMRQRIGIARALLGTPELLVVDEPTTGLDIEGRSRFRGLIMSIAAHRIVVLSTHIAGDVEATCSRVLLLHRGRLRFDGTPDELISLAEGQVFETVVTDHEAAVIAHDCRITRRIRVLDGVRIRGVVTKGAALPGPAVTPSLEDAYLVQIELAAGTGGGTRRFAFLKQAGASVA